MEISPELEKQLTIDQKETAVLTSPVRRPPPVVQTAMVAIAQAVVGGWLLYLDHERNVVLAILLFLTAASTAREHHLQRENYRMFTLAREIIEHYRSQKLPKV